MHHHLALIRRAVIFLVVSCLISLSQSIVVAQPSSMEVNTTKTIKLTIMNHTFGTRGFQLVIPIEFTDIKFSLSSTNTRNSSAATYTFTQVPIGNQNAILFLTLTAPSFTNDNLTFIVRSQSLDDFFIIPVYLNPTLPKPMQCNITKSSNTTLLIHDFTTTCSIGSLGINPNNYIGIIIPPYISPIIANNGTVNLIINRNMTYSGGETIKCYNSTNSSIFGDLNGYCIFYVMYNSSAPPLSQNDTLQLVVSNYFRGYPSTQTIQYEVGVFSNTVDLNVRQLSDAIPIAFSTPNSDAITINMLSNDCNGTEICNYLLNVSFNNPYNINQSILDFIDVLNLTITSIIGGGIFLNSTTVALDGANAQINVNSQENIVVSVSNQIDVYKGNNYFEMRISNIQNKIGQRSVIKMSIMTKHNNSLYGVALGETSLPINNCDVSCKTCSGLATWCTSCSASFLSNNSCVSQCPQGQFGNNATNVCAACDVSCKTCSGLATWCTSCSASFLSNNSCVSQCPQGQFGNNATNVCAACDVSCKTCSGLATWCTSCSASFLSNNSCVSQCPQGQFGNNATNVCAACDVSCKTCSGLATWCTSCSASFLSNNSCVSQCPQGQFGNNATNVCAACDVSCKTCSGLATWCTSCSASFLSNNSCVSQCPQGQFGNNATNVCAACDVSCKTCSGLATWCTSCSASFLSNNSCVSQCPQGQFGNNATNVCAACDVSCKTCSGLATWCTSCSASFLSNNSCVSQCPQGQFGNNATNVCAACDVSCKTCSGLATWCTSCSASFLSNNSCVSQCPQGFFANSTAFTCDSCDSSCKTCSGLASLCASCINSFLSSKTCVNQCPLAKFANYSSFTCDPCDKSCNTCINNSTNCLSCASTYNNASSLPSSCFPFQNCSNETVYEAGSCICSNQCLTCSISLSNCTSCASSLYLHFNTCLSNCSGGFFPNSADKSCSKCPTSCSTCTASSCLSCISTNYFIFNATCISSCPSSYFTLIVANASTCSPCPQGCKICTNGTYCDSCNPPLYFQKYQTQKLCVSTCSPNFFLFSDTCFNQCPSGYVVSNGKCVQNSSTSSSSSILLPLPLALAFTALLLLCFLSKFRVSQTILGATTCAFSGILQNFSWILLLIFSFLTINSKELSSTLAVYIIFVSLLVNLSLNVINLHLLRKYIWEDEKFARHLERMKGSKIGNISFYLIIFVSLMFSHKFSEILFSNLFRHTFFVFKVKSVLKFSPLNYVKFFSLLPSLVGIAAGALLFLQFRSTQNSLYWQSIDSMVISVISGICSIWVTRRRADFYQNNLNEKSLDLADFNFPNDPPAQVHFQMLRKEENSDNLSNKSGVRNYKVEVNTTQENLKSIEERPYFQQIHRVANQKDDIDNSLHNTRLTVNNTSRRRRVGNHEQTYEGMVPIRTNKRNLEQTNQQKRSRNKTYQDNQEEETIQDKIEKSFTYFEISALKVIKKTEAVIAEIEKEIKTQLRDSQHRINVQSDNDEMYSFIVDITESEMNLLQKETRDLVEAIRRAILKIEEANIKPRQFMEYINQIDGKNAENQKENRRGVRSPIPQKMPPLPYSKKSRGSMDSKGSKNGRRRNIKNSRSIENRLIINSNFQSPFVQEFAQSPIIGKSPAFQQSQIEQFQQMPSNLRKSPNTQYFDRNNKPVQSVYKTPDSQYQQEIKQSQNDDEIDSYIRPYQAVPTISRGYSGPLTPGKKKFDAPIMRQATVDYVETDRRGIDHEEIQVSKGMSNLKRHEMYQLRQENIDNSPRNPMISLSRLQNINKIDSIYYTDNRQDQFQNGESIAQVMDKYSKNGEKQKEYDDVPDEHQQKFKRIRRRGARANHRVAPNASQM